MPTDTSTLAAQRNPVELAWQITSSRAKGCTRPIRLVGSVAQVDKATGEIREVYNSDREMDGTLYRPCGNRRESVCPACSETYRRDAYHLITAGVAGGKGIPDTVTGHPAVFLTTSAPSFGPVHSRRSKGRVAEVCAPRGKNTRCPHGNWLACWERHDVDDPRLGEPICADCFDYEGLVIWNAHAPLLWKRTRQRIGRDLARLAGMSERQLRSHVRLTFIKVAEVQHRGATHFHGILRADAATTDGSTAPPPLWCDGVLLRDAFDAATATVWVPCLDPHAAEQANLDGTAKPKVVRWGTQNLARILHLSDSGLSPQAVAGYIAKYATKATDSIGHLDTRIRNTAELDYLQRRLRPHLHRIVATAWALGERQDLIPLKLRHWAHCLGFGGHWLTKSRAYSTTFGRLRADRQTWQRTVKRGELEPLDAWGRPESDDATEVLKAWGYVGTGYKTHAERELALATAARTREYRAAQRAARTAA